jgi:hypothetical protein
MSRPGFLIPLLALAALLFGWRAYEAWTGPLGNVGPPPPNPSAMPIGVSQEEAPPSPDLSASVTLIVARPIFRPDRQPFREETAAQIPKRNYEAELNRFTLLGVLLLGTDRKGVVVGKGAAGREERWEVAPGDSLPGFTVKDVGADGVTLAADEKEFLLPLYAGGPKTQPGQAPVRTDLGTPRPPVPAPKPPVASPPGTVRPPTGIPLSPPTAAPPMPPAAVPPAPPMASPPVTSPPSTTGSPVYQRGRMRPTYIPGRR